VTGAEVVPPPAPDEVTLLGPGDTVHINVWDHPDLTMTVEIGSDGNFQFPLIGGVHADRMTIAELEGDIRRRLADGYLVDPQVTARVESRGKYFYVYGEVAKPGRYPLDREVTVLQAISTAGGPTERADEGRSTVTRRDGERTVTRRVDLDEAVHDQDTLYVPISLF
jgi:polysaccharide export outer membrane protein